jgi:putative Holliday junction resolvase
MAATNSSVLALDVGSKRIGVAATSLIARLPHPLVTLDNDDKFFDALRRLIAEESAGVLVVGLPRGLQGQETDQTRVIESFVSELKQQVDLPVYMQDEAVTSEKAETELKQRGKPYSKGDIDALAATYILDDWLATQPEGVQYV